MNATYTYMQLMIESARQVGFCGEFFFYTHEDAQIPDDLPVSQVIRVAPKDVAVSDLMLLKAYGSHHFVHSDLFQCPTISVEADQLFQRNPMEAFSLPFDLGLTYAHWEKKIIGDFGRINGGVTYLNHTNPAALRSYFSAYLDKFLEIKDQLDHRRSYRPRLAEVGGGEVSHLRLLRPGALDNQNQQRQCFEVHGARVMMLESRKFNCQQGERVGDHYVFGKYPDTIIRHFVGWRKELMSGYALEYLNLKIEPSTENSWGTTVTKVEGGGANGSRR